MNKNLRNIFSFFMSCLFIFVPIAKSNLAASTNKKYKLEAKFGLNKYLITSVSLIFLLFFSSCKSKIKSSSSLPKLTSNDPHIKSHEYFGSTYKFEKESPFEFIADPPTPIATCDLINSLDYFSDSLNLNIHFKSLEQVKSTLREADFSNKKKYYDVIRSIDSLIDSENTIFSEDEFKFITETRKLQVLNNDQIEKIKQLELNSEIKDWMIFLGGCETKNRKLGNFGSLTVFLEAGKGTLEKENSFDDGNFVPAVLPSWVPSSYSQQDFFISKYYNELNSFFESNKDIFLIIQQNIVLTFFCMCKLWGMGIKNNRFAILNQKNFVSRILSGKHDLQRVSRSLTTVYMFFGEKVYKMFLIFLFQNLNHMTNSLTYFATVAIKVKSFVSGLI